MKVYQRHAIFVKIKQLSVRVKNFRVSYLITLFRFELVGRTIFQWSIAFHTLEHAAGKERSY